MSENFSIPTPGDVIAGKYRVMEELGRGAYGVVFRAEQIGLGRSVALKTLLPAAFLQMDIVQRFHREAQLISALDHENIIKLYDYGMDDSLLYMAVEYVQGRTLGEMIKFDAPLPEEKVHEIMDQLLSALEFAHERGIVHRDLKPDNILLLRSNPEEGIAEEIVKVLDFGIAKLVRGDQDNQSLKTLTQDGTVLGTPHYMSPENIVGDTVDHKTDLYAVGIILFEMLTGKHPFEAQSPSAVMVRHLKDDAPHLPEPWTNSAFDHAIQRCLEKQPFDRVESAAEIRELLNSEPPVVVPIPSVTEETPIKDGSRLRRYRAVLLALALFAVLAISVGWKIWTAKDAFKKDRELEAVTVTVPDPKPEIEVHVPPEPDLGSDDLAESVSDAGDAQDVPDSGEEPSGFEFEEDPQPQPRPKDRTPAEPKTKVEVRETVKIVLTTSPPNASVTFDGVPVGNSPVEKTVSKSDETITVRVSLLGYKNEVLKITPQDDVEREVRLQFDRIKMFD